MLEELNDKDRGGLVLCGASTEATKEHPCNPPESDTHDCDLAPHNGVHKCGCGYEWFNLT